MPPWPSLTALTALRRTAHRRLSTASATASLHPNPIEKIIHDSIKASGPMTVSSYMQLCLAHPTHGYYMNPANAVFGRKGDFITSPEISQVFGELIAIWHLTRWLAAGSPPNVRVVELGPGRGTLLADALRAWSQFPAFKHALKEIRLVETSPAMRKLQEETVKKSLDECGKKGMSVAKSSGSVAWHDSLEEAQETSKADGVFTMLVAHELFDALPVHIIEKGADGWSEILVSNTPDPTAKTTISSSATPSQAGFPPLRLVRSPTPTAAANLLGALSPRYATIPNGSRVEVSPASFKLARQVAEIVNDRSGSGGSALVIDYGSDKLSGSSLRAFKDHKLVDPLTSPGQCDLTANADFALLREAITGSGQADKALANVHGPITQNAFLTRMGIHARVAQLQAALRPQSKHPQVLTPSQPLLSDKDKAGEEAAERIGQGARRLLDLTGMGVQYNVLGITGTGGREVVEEKVWPFEE